MIYQARQQHTINLHYIFSDLLHPPNPPLLVMADNSSIPEVGEGSVPPPCLMKAEVSWMSTVRGNLSYEERILRRVSGVLNRLTVEKYKLQRTQLIDSRITTPSILHGVASLILNKTLAEPMFCLLYAFLCSKLFVYGQLPSFPPDEHGGGEITFRCIPLNECQQAFEHENVKVAEIRKQIVTGSLSRDLGWRRNLGFMKDVLTTHPQLETRMIRNLLDLRANNWVEPRHNKVKDKMIYELISASDAEALSRLHPGASTSTNTRTHREVQFRPINRPDPHCW